MRTIRQGELRNNGFGRGFFRKMGSEWEVGARTSVDR